MMLIILQRPPTIASAEGLVIDPLSSSALKLLHEQKENPPWAEQGLATYSNCYLLKDRGPRTGCWSSLNYLTCEVLAQDLVQHHKVADVVVKVEGLLWFNFWTVG